jgi:hypothetical protein
MIDDKKFEALEARVEKLEKASGKRQPPKDVSIDDEYGDPLVFRDPPRWKAEGHPSFEKVKFSECPPDYLENLSKFLAWAGEADDKQGRVDKNGKSVGWRKARDSVKAAKWAERKRAAGEKDCLADGPKKDDDGIPF